MRLRTQKKRKTKIYLNSHCTMADDAVLAFPNISGPKYTWDTQSNSNKQESVHSRQKNAGRCKTNTIASFENDLVEK